MKKIIYLLLMILSMRPGLAQSVYFQEDFESGNLSGWVLEGLWESGNNSSFPGLIGGVSNNSSYLGYDDLSAGNGQAAAGRAISPTIDLTQANESLFLEMSLKFRNADQFGLDETIMLEVSTDNGTTWEVFEVFDDSDWEHMIIDFSVYAGEIIKLSFSYNDGGGFNIGAAIDDVAVSESLVFIDSRNYILTVDGGSLFDECVSNIDYEISGVVMNKGFDAITSFDIRVTSPSGIEDYSFSTDIKRDEVHRYSIPELYNTGSNFSKLIIEVRNVNGSLEPDNNINDNIREIEFDPIDVDSNKGVFIEEGTGFWCTACPIGKVFVSEISKRFGKHVSASEIHTGDPLAIPEYEDGMFTFGVIGVPQIIFHRQDIIGPEYILEPLVEELSKTSEVIIDIGATKVGNKLSPTVKLDFKPEFDEESYKVFVLVTEDDLAYEGSQWDQKNAYFGIDSDIGGWELFPLSTPSSYWPSDHVARLITEGFFGKEVSNNPASGSQAIVIELEDIQLNPIWNTDKMKITVAVMKSSGEVVNVISKKLQDVIDAGVLSNSENSLYITDLEVGPNPVANNLFIRFDSNISSDVNINIYDSIGRTILSKSHDNQSNIGEYNINVVTWPAGIYYLELTNGKNSITKKLFKNDF